MAVVHEEAIEPYMPSGRLQLMPNQFWPQPTHCIASLLLVDGQSSEYGCLRKDSVCGLVDAKSLLGNPGELQDSSHWVIEVM
jgi:hypothetical protein